MRFLLIQVEGDKRTAIQTMLERAGHQTTVSTVRKEVESLARDCDAVLLNPDELPDMDFAFVWSLRMKGVQTPLMLVTEADIWSGKLITLATHADDSVMMPISEARLLGRILLMAARPLWI